MLQTGIQNDITTILEAPDVAQPMVNKFYVYESNALKGRYSRYSNETVDLLITLYQSLVTREEKEEYLKILKDALNSERMLLPFLNKNREFKRLLKNNVDYIFMFFVRIGDINTALSYYEKVYIVNDELLSVLEVTNSLLTNEPRYFDRVILDNVRSLMDKITAEIKESISFNKIQQEHERLKKLHGAGVLRVDRVEGQETPKEPRFSTEFSQQQDVEGCQFLINKIIEHTKHIKLKFLKEKLEGVNVEINRDKEILKEKINEFKFDKELGELLDNFERGYQSDNKFDLKSSVGHIRTFTEKLCLSIAIRIHEASQVEPPDGKLGSMITIRNYFNYKKVGFLSEKQDKFLESLYALSSDDKIGVHSLTSDREHARIIKNVSIENGLFLIRLMEKYLTDLKK